jgi:hypothetical protein
MPSGRLKISLVSIACVFLFVTLIPSHASVQNLKTARQFAEPGAFHSGFIRRNAAFAEFDPSGLMREGGIFKGPALEWLRTSLYNHVRKGYVGLARYMGIDFPGWFRSPDTFTESFHRHMDMKNVQGEKIKDANLSVPLRDDPKVLENLPDDAKARAEEIKKRKKQKDRRFKVGDVIADLSGTYTKSDGSEIPPRSLGEVMDVLNYEAWRDLIGSQPVKTFDPLKHGPFANLIDHVRGLESNRGKQLTVAYEIVHLIKNQEIAINQKLSALYDKLLRLNKEIEELNNDIRTIEADPSPTAHQNKILEKAKARRARVSKEYITIVEDLSLFIRLKQYNIRFTLEYLYGVLQDAKGFRAFNKLDDVITTVDTGLRSSEGLSRDAQQSQFAEEAIRDSLPDFKGMESSDHRFGRAEEDLDRANRARFMDHPLRSLAWGGLKITWKVVTFPIVAPARFIYSFMSSIPSRFGLGHWNSWRFDGSNLFPCIRSGTILYYCKLHPSNVESVNDLLTQFRNRVDSADPSKVDLTTHKFYADLRDELIGKARSEPRMNHPDILQGLHSLLTQMNPHSRSGRQLRNFLNEGRESLEAFTSQRKRLEDELSQTLKDRADIEAEAQSLRNNPDPDSIAVDLRQKEAAIKGFSQNIDDLNSQIAKLDQRSDIEHAALDLSQNRVLIFTSNGMPIHDFPTLGKFLSLDNPVFWFTYKRFRSLYHHARGFSGGGWIANGISEQAGFFARTRKMLGKVENKTLQEDMLKHLKSAESRASTVLRASFQLGLTPAQSRQLMSGIYAPRDQEIFINILEGFVHPYRNFTENRAQLFEKFEQLEGAYRRDLNELDENFAQSLRSDGDPTSIQKNTENIQLAIGKAHALRQELIQIEEALGLDVRTAKESADAPLAVQKELHTTTDAYHQLRTKFNELNRQIADLEAKNAEGGFSETAARDVEELKLKRDNTDAELKVQADKVKGLIEDFKEFAGRQERLESELIALEELERNLSRHLGKRSDLLARIAKIERALEKWDAGEASGRIFWRTKGQSEMLLTQLKSELKALEDPLAEAQKLVDAEKAKFKASFPNYNLEARLRRTKLGRDLPGRRGAKWNQLTYEMLRSSGFERHALEDGGEALALVQRLRRYGLETGDETWGRMVRQCVMNSGNGRAMLQSRGIGGLNPKEMHLKFWTQDFYKQFIEQDPFTNSHNDARLSFLEDAVLPHSPTVDQLILPPKPE